MTPERWEQVQELLDAVLEVPSEERVDFLGAMDAEPEVVRDVKELLALETAAEDFIRQPLLELGKGSRATDRVGQRLGPYRLVREIGRGGMGSVYLGERADEEYDQRVAVKILKRGLDTDEILRRFRNERQILAGFEHPNIARLRDGGTTDDGLPYLVMEYVEGRPIDVYCREEKLDIEARLELFLATCSAVEEAHRRLVVHRDLKPKNILVTPEGVPKLLDFGIAKLLDPAAGETVVTVAGWRLLTPQYAAPEQVSGGSVTTRTDLYSLGVVLYELLADQRPYDLPEPSTEALARILAAGPPELPSQRAPAARAPRLRGDLDNIVMKALQQEPERRYDGVGQLAEDLRRHLAGQPVLAAPDSAWYRMGKFVRRHRVGVALAALFLALVVGFGVISWALLQEAQRGRLEASNSIEAINDVFQVGDPERFSPDSEPAGDMPLSEMILIGIRKMEVRLAKQPASRSSLLQTFGGVLSSRGSTEEAEGLLLRALDARIEADGPEAPEVGEIQNELAGVYVQRGELSKAETLTRDALENLRRHSPDPSSDVSRAKTNLAMILDRADRHKEADQLHQQLLEDWEALGEEEPLATVLNNYGSSLTKRGRHEKAIPLLRRALEIRRRTRGDDNPTTARSWNNYGSALENAGFLGDAVPAYAEALRIHRARYPEGHRSVVIALNNYALARFAQGATSEATSRLGEAVEQSEELDLRPSLHVVFERNFAWVSTEAEPVKAESMARQALNRFPRDRDHWRQQDVRSVLGGTLVVQGRFEEAEDLLIPAYSGLLDERGEDDRYTQEARQRVIHLYETWGQPEKADPYRQPTELAQLP